MTDLYYPLRSLREGNWFKLICGASFQHLPAVQNLALIYTLAGVDCIDVAADPAVVSVAKAAIETAVDLAGAARERGFDCRGAPWLMVSFNDGEDPHFRKAEFEAANCPSNCPKPCEAICPAQAIAFSPAQAIENFSSDFQPATETLSGVISERCYGCGRCLPVCPEQHIFTRSYVSAPAAVVAMILQAGVDAIEIHTQVGRLTDFQRLWQAIAPWINQLKLISISCPDGEGLIDYLRALHECMSPLPCPLIWQTDGRPMSGDIGVGATKAAVKLSQKVLAANLPGYVQLAGGTNHHTVSKLKALGLLSNGFLAEPSATAELATPVMLSNAHVAGVAYGSYARTLLSSVLDKLEAVELTDSVDGQRMSLAQSLQCSIETGLNGNPAAQPNLAVRQANPVSLEERFELLWQAVSVAYTLVSHLKSPCSS